MLAIISSHFNPAGFHSPRRNLLRFMRQCATLDTPLFISELAYDDEPFFLPASRNVFHYRCPRGQVLWHKENLLNLAVERLPKAYDKIAWIDPDLWLERRDWVEAAERKLEHFAVVQLFDRFCRTNLDGEIIDSKISFAAQGGWGENANGGAWAARRELWTKAGGLYERAIVGSGDVAFCAAAIRNALPAYLGYLTSDWSGWAKKAGAWIEENGGFDFLEGRIVHEWHGEMRDRSYLDRHGHLAKLDVGKLVARRADGLLQYAPSVPASFAARIEEYFKLRKEDA